MSRLAGGRISITKRKVVAVVAAVCAVVALALAGLGMSSAYYVDRETVDNEVGFTALHRLTFDAAGGSIDGGMLPDDVLASDHATLTRTVADGAPVGRLPMARRGSAAGELLFAGWFDVSAGDEVPEAGEDDVATTDATYRARWNVAITLAAGEGVIDGDTVQQGDEISEDGTSLRRVRGEGMPVGALPAASRVGYDLVGWHVTPDGEDGDAVDEATVPTGNVTYHAHWSRVTAVVTFDPNGGAIDPKSARTSEQIGASGTLERVVGTGDELGTPPLATRSDREYTYELVGWYTTGAESGGVRATAATIVDGAITYYARWARQQGSHTVTFNAGDGAFANGSKFLTRTRAHNAELGELPDAPTRRRHRFLGWYTTRDGNTQVSEHTRVSSDVTFFAHWGAQVIFDANGGSFPDGGTRVVYGRALGDALDAVPTGPAWVDDSHSFAGWYTEAYGGRLVSVSASNKVVRSYTFYAHWDVEVCFDPAGGTFGDGGTGVRWDKVNSEMFGVGSLPALRTRDDRVLDGWYTEPDGRGTRVCAYSRPTPGATYYACWRAAGAIHYATATVGGVSTLYLSSHAIKPYPTTEGETLGVISAYEGGRAVSNFSGDASQDRTYAGVGWSAMSFTRVVVLDRIAPTTCEEWFATRSGSGWWSTRYGVNVSSIEGLANIDMTDVTSMEGMFYGASNLSLTDDDLACMGAWNVTSKVTSLRQMLSGVGQLNADAGATLDLSSWDVSGVRDAYRMFYNAYVSGTLNASTWNLANVSVGSTTGTAYMFYMDATSGRYGMRLDLSGAVFNQRETSTFAGGSIRELVIGPGWTRERGDLNNGSACYMLEPSDIGTDGMATATTYSSGYYRSIPIQAWHADWADAGVSSLTYRYFTSTDAASAAAGVIRENADAHAAAFEALAAALPAPRAVTSADAGAIAEARASYDALWSREHLLVNNELVSKLVACECRLKALAAETTARPLAAFALEGGLNDMNAAADPIDSAEDLRLLPEREDATLGVACDDGALSDNAEVKSVERDNEGAGPSSAGTLADVAAITSAVSASHVVR